MHQVYGIDIEEVLDTRSWRWLQCKIIGLLETECRIQRHFAPPEQTNKNTRGGGGRWR